MIGLRNINKDDYPLVIEMDNEIYPSLVGVTVHSMSVWYERNPEFGLIFTDGQMITGALVCIPLKKTSWISLTRGEISEASLDHKDIFDINRDSEIAIHIYHIVKLTKDITHFARIALAELNKRVRNLCALKTSLRISGYSAYCATPQGLHLFSDTLAFRESGGVSEEHIVRSLDGSVRIEIGTAETVMDKMATSDAYVCKCSMLALTLTDKSELWSL